MAELALRQDGQVVQAEVPPEQAEKIHTVLQEFVELVVVVAAKIISMKSAEARRYLDGGG